jgi:hypothetical protein
MSLTPDERALLERADVKALAPAERRAYLRQNRRVATFVVLFAGGVRLLVLGGGAAAATVFGIVGIARPETRDGTAIALVIGGLALSTYALWIGARLLRRLAELRAPIDESELSALTHDV